MHVFLCSLNQWRQSRDKSVALRISHGITLRMLHHMHISKMALRNQNCRDVVAAIVNRQEPTHDVARIFNVPQSTVFDWLAWFRTEGWDGFNEERVAARANPVGLPAALIAPTEPG